MSSAPSRRGLVMVVDDEEVNRTLLRDPLVALGYEVTEAQNGAEALQDIAQRPPDIILLDVMMPSMDGFEVCRQVRKNGRTMGIPILMVTALCERQERLMGIAAGANDFLTKPIDVQDMMLRVGNATTGKRLADQVREQRERAERLLLNVLPKSIADRMEKGEMNIADHYPDTTVLVADLVGFTTLCFHIGPVQVVHFLNEIFSTFDGLAEKHGLEKTKTIGDAYMVAGGVPVARSDHAEAIAALALDMQSEITRLNAEYNTSLQIRIGLCTGPVVAGVIGRKKFAYDLWGDTVNLAFRLGASANPGCIVVGASSQQRLKDSFLFAAKQEMEIKGHGKVPTYNLLGRA